MEASRLTRGVWEAPFVTTRGDVILVATDERGTLLEWAAVPANDPARQRAEIARLTRSLRRLAA